MTATVEIDRAGRIVVPKKLRDALHLSPGTRISFQLRGEAIVITPDTPHTAAYQKDGLWVYRAPGPEKVTPDEIRGQLEDRREEREGRTRGKVPAA